MLKLPDIKLPEQLTWLKTSIIGMGGKLNTQVWKIGEKVNQVGQKLNNKKVILSVTLSVWLILGWLVWWKVYTNKGLVKDILGIEEINNWPAYIIDKWKEKKWTPWEKWDKMLVLFTTPDWWEKYIVELTYDNNTNYYLEFKIYELKIPWQKTPTYIVECPDRRSKKELPKGGIIKNEFEIRHIKSSSSTTWIPYLPQVKDK